MALTKDSCLLFDIYVGWGQTTEARKKVKPAAPSPLCSAARREVEILESLPHSSVVHQLSLDQP